MRLIILFALFIYCALVSAQPKAILDLVPGRSVVSSAPAAVDGLIEYTLDNGHVFYASQDGRFVFDGTLIDIADSRDLTADAKARHRKARLLDLPGSLFEYPADTPRAEVLVVTDIDCPYCRRLHQMLPEYNERGISVRYIMLPRSGLAGESAKKAIAAACAEMPELALDAAMAGEEIPQTTCTNTVASQFDFAQSVGVDRTPTILLNDGHEVAGFASPDELANRLGLR